MHTRTIWHPNVALGVPVFGCAAIVFPLHLGWMGASWVDLAIYIAFAALLFSAVDALAAPRLNRLPLAPQSVLILLAIAAPGALAFAVGSIAGPIDETMDERTCLAAGAGEEDSLAAEDDDTFDLTPDCVRNG